MTTASTKYFVWAVSAVARLALRVVGVLFIYMAVIGFIRGLWELAKFFAGIFYYGAVVVHTDTFYEQLGAALGALITPLLCGAFGTFPEQACSFAAGPGARKALSVLTYCCD